MSVGNPAAKRQLPFGFISDIGMRWNTVPGCSDSAPQVVFSPHFLQTVVEVRTSCCHISHNCGCDKQGRAPYENLL